MCNVALQLDTHKNYYNKTVDYKLQSVKFRTVFESQTSGGRMLSCFAMLTLKSMQPSILGYIEYSYKASGSLWVK